MKNTLAISLLLGLQHPWSQTVAFATHKSNGAFHMSKSSKLADDVTEANPGVCRAMSSSGVCEDRVSDAAAVVSDANLALLSSRGRAVLEKLIADGGQSHVYSHWPEAGVDDARKIQMADQLADLDESYPGGLTAYIRKARKLLAESAAGTNPFEDYTASVPKGESLTYNPKDDVDGGMSFHEAEQLGLEAIADVAFVLVAGGLGERLGYSGIKLSLETNLCTNSSYLQVYAKYIQAMQRMAEVKLDKPTGSVKIPLVIMTSGDTDKATRELLQANDNFGFQPDQVQIVMQDKVPALMNSNAALSLKGDDPYKIETKPHGHGDVHHLLLKHGHVDKWEREGRTHVIFLQDTNALVINGILPTLGVSIANGFHMNSICIPRLAGEAAGAITSLEHKHDSSKNLVINVEYNQLDPLLRTQGDKKGDVADPTTGFSPYPGNANNLVMEMKSYAKTLRGEDEGVVVEFVNPKYKDSTRTEFKKPTRLECMMQDFPKLLQKEMTEEAPKIGFTQLERWFSFSPAKNSLESGIEAIASGSAAPGTMSSAESDKYIQNQRKLAYAGMSIPSDAEQLVVVGGIPVTPGPHVILSPSFAITQAEILQKIDGGSLTTRSSLVLDGEDLTVKNLALDGALVIKAAHGCKVTVDGLSITNKGWELQEIPEEAKQSKTVPEEVSIRGYTMAKHETAEYIIEEPGEYVIGADGVLQKL